MVTRTLFGLIFVAATAVSGCRPAPSLDSTVQGGALQLPRFEQQKRVSQNGEGALPSVPLFVQKNQNNSHAPNTSLNQKSQGLGQQLMNALGFARPPAVPETNKVTTVPQPQRYAPPQLSSYQAIVREPNTGLPMRDPGTGMVLTHEVMVSADERQHLEYQDKKLLEKEVTQNKIWNHQTQVWEAKERQKKALEEAAQQNGQQQPQ